MELKSFIFAESALVSREEVKVGLLVVVDQRAGPFAQGGRASSFISRENKDQQISEVDTMTNGQIQVGPQKGDNLECKVNYFVELPSHSGFGRFGPRLGYHARRFL